MEICSRCKINKAELNCKKCKNKFCKLCDYFVHEIMENINNKNRLIKKDEINSSETKTTASLKLANNNFNEKNNRKKNDDFNPIKLILFLI